MSTPSSRSSPRYVAPAGVRRLGVVLAAMVVVWAAYAHFHTSGAADQSPIVAGQSGASSCSRSAYQLKNRLDGSESQIYECYFPNGKTKCVTLEDGIARDVTEEVRVLFETTLGSGKPGCV